MARAQELLPEDQEELVKKFLLQYDTDNDGSITKEEWKDYHLKLFDDMVKEQAR